MASPTLAWEVARTVADTIGSEVLRCHPYPFGLVGEAGPLRSMLAELPAGDTDADRVTEMVLSGRTDVVLDVSSEVFHVLDGTGTDVVVVSGRAHAGGARPLVLIDLDPEGKGLELVQADAEDAGGRDLGRLFRYDGAVAGAEVATATAPGVLVTPLWTPDFCTTLIRAAEAAALWMNVSPEPWAVAATWLPDLVPPLFALLKMDIDERVWPLLQMHWPDVEHAGLQSRGHPQVPGRSGDGGFPGSRQPEPNQRLGPAERRLPGGGTDPRAPGMGRHCRRRRRARGVAATRPRQVHHRGHHERREIPARPQMADTRRVTDSLTRAFG